MYRNSHFYPRPPRGGRLKHSVSTSRRGHISIHALREEGDAQGHQASGSQIIFLSTPSARRATVRQAVRRSGGSDFYPRPPRGGRRCRRADRWRGHSISIHALREEGDQTSQVKKLHRHDFYPRPPRGGRRQSSKQICRQTDYFYPRPPRGGRHSQPTNGSTNRPISIHALREEGDLLQRQGRLFQRVISIHALREEGDGFLLC